MKGTLGVGVRVENGGEDPRQDLTFGYWHFHPGVDGGQPFGVARAQSLHCLRPARSFYARVNASLWGPREDQQTDDGGEVGKGMKEGGTWPSPVELTSIAHVPATLSIPRIHYAPTRSPGTRLSLSLSLCPGRESISLRRRSGLTIDIRDRDRGAMSTSSVSLNVSMDNACSRAAVNFAWWSDWNPAVISARIFVPCALSVDLDERSSEEPCLEMYVSL